MPAVVVEVSNLRASVICWNFLFDEYNSPKGRWLTGYNKFPLKRMNNSNQCGGSVKFWYGSRMWKNSFRIQYRTSFVTNLDPGKKEGVPRKSLKCDKTLISHVLLMYIFNNHFSINIHLNQGKKLKFFFVFNGFCWIRIIWYGFRIQPIFDTDPDARKWYGFSGSATLTICNWS